LWHIYLEKLFKMHWCSGLHSLAIGDVTYLNNDFKNCGENGCDQFSVFMSVFARFKVTCARNLWEDSLFQAGFEPGTSGIHVWR
jgi:hypothetical protein